MQENRSRPRRPSAATLTLFCGLPGSGKSTLARRLAVEGRGVRLSTDEWRDALGFAPSDDEVHGRLQRLLYRHALDLLRQGTDVILEDGLWMAHERTEKFADARACGARIELHGFDVDQQTLWSRLQRRNADPRPGDHPVSEEELRWASGLFEPLTPAEVAAVDAYTVHTGGLG